MRSLALALSVALLLDVPSTFAAASHSVVLGAATCRDAKSHFAKCPPPAAVSSMSHHPVCKKGKACGNSCIAKDKVCHK